MKLNFTLLPLLMLLSGCETLSEVDKGLYGVADSMAKPDVITGQRSANFATREKQIEKGNAAAQKEIQQYGANINESVDKAAYERLENIFNKVHSVTHYRTEQWQVILIPDPSFNAFATGGTIIVVNKGVFDVIQSDDELAAILGHEMGHIAANHTGEGQAVMATKIRHIRSEKTKNFGTAFTVEQEREADKVGILYTALSGYDPFAVSHIWDRMYKQRGNNAFMLNNHPMNSERSAAATIIANQVKQYYTPNQINPNFAAILDNNNLWHKNTLDSAVDAGNGGGILAVATATLNTMAKIQTAKNEQMEQNRRIRLVKSVASLLSQQGWDILSDNSYGFHFQYTGYMPIQNLVLKTKYGEDELLFRSEDTIYPNQKFTAVFNTNESVQRNKVQSCCIVDSVESGRYGNAFLNLKRAGAL